MSRDIARAIEVALTELVDPDQIDSVTVADAVRAAMQEHEHEFLDRWIRPTNDVSEAKHGRCRSCGNADDLWCDTVTAIATALGVNAGVSS